MPKRLIDANALYQEVKTECVKKVLELIDEAPTIESEPVRHGRWINDTFCSECNRFPVDVSVPISNRELTKYFSRCPSLWCTNEARGVIIWKRHHMIIYLRIISTDLNYLLFRKMIGGKVKKCNMVRNNCD